jgi:hypothetical protein
LHRELASGQQKVLTQTSGGEPQHILTIPLDEARLDELFAMIARGLIWYHWQVFLEKNYVVQTRSVTRSGERFFDEYLFKLKDRDRVRGNLGDGAFIYEGAQAVDGSGITIWRFDIYGGLVSCEDPAAPEKMGSQMIVITTPEAVFKVKTE